MELKRSVQSLKGIGPKTSELLKRMGISTVDDLLMHFPRSYEDRSRIKKVSALLDGETAAFKGRVSNIDKGRYTRNGKHLSRIVMKDETGQISCIWFNQKFIVRNFTVGEEYLVYGKVSAAFNEKQIINPQYEKLEDEIHHGITPVYPLTKNLSQKVLRNTILNLISSGDFYIEDVLPQYIKERFQLCNIGDAIKNIHFPRDFSAIKDAEKRLKFEELLILQLGLMMEKKSMESNSGISFPQWDSLRGFMVSLPFELTNAQRKCISEILDDMESKRQMNRLVQGDVGSGKTIVAVVALLNCVKNRYQGVLMAPTEILAAQHYESITALYKGWDVKMALLTSKTVKIEKEEIKEKIRSGDLDIVVGTHALLQDTVVFSNLGLVITDEQHRFGVRQRALLGRKGLIPDVLVMTATPIPRTMGLFIYGDLDLSIIDEMPPGRQKVDTYTVKPESKDKVYNFVRSEVSKGRQAYVVCPLIEESDLLDVESAVETAEKLQKQYLRGLKVGLLHGKMKQEEKNEIMEKFKHKEIDVLVSTTVIEVGINIPSAVIMVVENADRFGLAQLHQLRGRVGRGSDKSYCILICGMETEVSRKRMRIMREYSDGLKIAEMDMEIRGTGEFLGMRQHGLPELRLADITGDVDILKAANSLAKELVWTGRINEREFEELKNTVQRKFFLKDENIAYN